MYSYGHTLRSASLPFRAEAVWCVEHCARTPVCTMAANSPWLASSTGSPDDALIMRLLHSGSLWLLLYSLSLWCQPTLSHDGLAYCLRCDHSRDHSCRCLLGFSSLYGYLAA